MKEQQRKVSNWPLRDTPLGGLATAGGLATGCKTYAFCPAGARIMLHTKDSFSLERGTDLPLLLKAIQAEEAELERPIRANRL